MTDENNLAYSTIEELAALLTKRKISPVELTKLFLRRIEQHNPSLNALLTVTDDQALDSARRAEKLFLAPAQHAARANLPLLGIPVAIKDNIWTRGIRTTSGSKILQDFIPTQDATAFRKIARAGAILPGQNKFERIRLWNYRKQCALWPGAQSLGAGSNFWRIQFRLRGGNCSGTLRGFRRHGYRRLDSRSFRLLRNYGIKTDVWAGQRLWRAAALSLARSCRSRWHAAFRTSLFCCM